MKREQTDSLIILLVKPPLNHSIPKEQEMNRDLTFAGFIFRDTNEAVGSEGSHERISESDGISPTITGQMTCAIYHLPDQSSPGLLSGTRNGLLQPKHGKFKDCGMSQGSRYLGTQRSLRTRVRPPISATVPNSQVLGVSRREGGCDSFPPKVRIRPGGSHLPTNQSS